MLFGVLEEVRDHESDQLRVRDKDDGKDKNKDKNQNTNQNKSKHADT